MKLFEAFFYMTYRVLLLFIGMILLIGIAVMASEESWYYLLLYVPILLYYYGSGTMSYGTKK